MVREIDFKYTFCDQYEFPCLQDKNDLDSRIAFDNDERPRVRSRCSNQLEMPMLRNRSTDIRSPNFGDATHDPSPRSSLRSSPGWSPHEGPG